ncbi:hypothetical protein O2W18_03170 [Modestobacter sp. VKM Ac-2983]|uniref:hypothetical protein n=1 Tax=Modestobacter sp. VKM Ac-2983 TaxID=3004137 RepID=UPI0022ABAAB1|nr:hypothetical protein [Modestobacter sp. VKM Ac-2983]MCZ2804096.1 hypothetical protein [Modestobacter sp. VKM Ac-2983]
MSSSPTDEVDPSGWASPRRRRLVLAGAILVVVALVLVGVLIGGGDDRRAEAAAETSAGQSSAGAIPSSAAGPSSADPVPPTVSSAPTDNAPVATAPTEGGDELPPSLAPVGLSDSATVGGGLTAALTAVRAIEGEGTGPGNVAGPALAVTVRLTNGTADRITLDGAVVSLAYTDDARPASPLDDPSAAPLSGVLEPGSSAEGVYVFSVPADRREVVTVAIGYEPGAPYLVFTGSVA